MVLPGMSEEKDVRLLLKKLLEDAELVLKFAVVARGPKDGNLILSRTEKLKRLAVAKAAEEEPENQNKGKPVKLDVMAGECRLATPGGTVLLVIAHGKAPARAVACIEHLLTLGPYKALGFTGIRLEELDEDGTKPTETAGTVESEPSGQTTGEPPSPPQDVQGQDAPSSNEGPNDLLARLKSLLLRMKSVTTLAPDERQRLEPLGRAAATAVQQGSLGAVEALNQLEHALNSVRVTEPQGDAKESKVAYAKLMLLWETAKKSVKAELQHLEKNVLESFAGDPDLPKLQDGVRRLDDILGGFDSRLQDLLDEGLSVPEDERAALHESVLDVVAEYRQFAESDPLIGAVGSNPFAPVTVQKTLVTALSMIAKQLTA